MVNIMAAVLLGPWWATLVAFAAAVFRNATGVGTPFAFPGGMIGALLAGVAWRATAKLRFAAAGEIVGTGIIAAGISVLVIAPGLMGEPRAVAFLFASFMLSTVVGTAVGLVALVALRNADVVEFESQGGSGSDDK
jgi:energy-coupling factor transport system ATP-binding protein